MSTEASRNDKAEDRLYLDDPPQPLLQGKVPKMVESTKREGVRFFPPIFPQDGKTTQILAVGISPTPEEASSIFATQYAEHYQKPRLLKGPLGQILKDCVDRFPELQSDRLTYATAIPWLLPKTRRFRPNATELEWTKPYLRDLVNHTKPQVIIAFGKLAFDQLVDFKISADDARGGWFDCEGIPVYLMDPAHQMVTQPWTLDTVITDFKEVARMVSLRSGTTEAEEPVRHQEIRTIEQLEALVAHWEANNITLFCNDNEWKGANFVDGQLRSSQFAWTTHDCAYLNFFNEHGEPILGRTLMMEGMTREERLNKIKHECYCYEEANKAKALDSPFFKALFDWRCKEYEEAHQKLLKSHYGIKPDGTPAKPGEYFVDYERVGEILGQWLNRPEIRYIGHYFSADSPWLEDWLNLEVLGRCVADTAFLMQTISEYAPQGLDRLALQVTNFGRYDMPLVMEKKNLKIGKDEGYGRIPDSVLVPYGGLDVIVPFRAVPILEKELERQGTLTYYRTIVLPLVTDTFHTFCHTGLPVDRELFEATRKFMNWAYRELLKDFMEAMAKQADELVEAATGIPAAALTAIRSTQPIAAKGWVLTSHPDTDEKLLDHWANIAEFNIRSGPVMTRWLFDVMKFTPVKTTGKPSMSWEKVLTLDPKIQKSMNPAADKETIEILSEVDDTGMLPKLLNLSNVGNICKGFLKEGDVDQDGEVVKENGLAKFIARDSFIHGMWSLTETSRPRTWKPNCLNLSKYLNKYIMRGLLLLLDKVEIPQEFEILFGSAEEREGMKLKDLIKERVPSVRSVVKAPNGWCLTESDYKTAEIRGQGFISGDTTLIELMTGKDKSFALYKGQPVRLYFTEDTKILKENQDPAFIMAWCEEGKTPIPLRQEDLDRDEAGNLIHPPYDLHWSLAEDLKGKAREAMINDIDRGLGKECNFCIAEGELVLTKERGLVPIQEIMCCDTLWDGVEWVSHEGIIISGYKEVIHYQGLWATERHKVWTEENGRTTLGMAKSSSLSLKRVAEAFIPYPYSRVGDFSRHSLSYGEMHVDGKYQMPHLRGGAVEECSEYASGAFYEVSVPKTRLLVGSVSGQRCEGAKVACGEISSHETALRQGHTRLFPPLQGAWYQMPIQGSLRVRGLGSEEVAGRGLCEEGFRPEGQRWALLSGEFEACNTGGELVEQRGYRSHQYRYSQRVSKKASFGEIHGEDHPWSFTFFFDRTGNTSETPQELARRTQKKRLVLTYDILNAGPRNRFACSGVIVSNSGAYLITPNTLERRLEAKLGFKPEPGTGQAALDSLEGRQPVSVQYIKDVSQYPKHGTTLQAQSGRIRHFPVHSSEIKGMPWRVAQGILRAMGNEAANFLYQESVAATLARACKWLNDFFRKHKMQARCNMGLYDSCVTLCPLEERWVVDAAHTLFMDRINIWCYHGRYMSYPIDTDFVYRWSWKPTKAQKAELRDKTFVPMEIEREKFLLSELAQIEKNFFDVQPWILQRLNCV